MGFVNGPNIQTFRLNRSSFYRAKTHAKCIQIQMVLVRYWATKKKQNISSREIESHQIKRQNKRIHFVSNCEGYEQSKKKTIGWRKNQSSVRFYFNVQVLHLLHIHLIHDVSRTHAHAHTTQRKSFELRFIDCIHSRGECVRTLRSPTNTDAVENWETYFFLFFILYFLFGRV